MEYWTKYRNNTKVYFAVQRRLSLDLYMIQNCLDSVLVVGWVCYLKRQAGGSWQYVNYANTSQHVAVASKQQ